MTQPSNHVRPDIDTLIARYDDARMIVRVEGAGAEAFVHGLVREFSQDGAADKQDHWQGVLAVLRHIPVTDQRNRLATAWRFARMVRRVAAGFLLGAVLVGIVARIFFLETGEGAALLSRMLAFFGLCLFFLLAGLAVGRWSKRQFAAGLDGAAVHAETDADC